MIDKGLGIRLNRSPWRNLAVFCLENIVMAKNNAAGPVTGIWLFYFFQIADLSMNIASLSRGQNK